jgi:hypothetical protein
VALLHAAVGQVFFPARTALLVHLVRGDQLVAANALEHMNPDLIRLVGPAIGGALSALAGFGSVVCVDAASFVASALLVALVRPRTLPDSRIPRRSGALGGQWRGVWRHLISGWSVVRTRGVLVALFAVDGLVSIGNGIWGVLWNAWVHDVLRGGPLELGWLLTARGIGGIAGVVLAGTLVGRWLAAGHNTDRMVFAAGLVSSAMLPGLGGTGLAAAQAGPAGTVSLLDLTCGLYAAAGLVALMALRR